MKLRVAVSMIAVTLLLATVMISRFGFEAVRTPSVLPSEGEPAWDCEGRVFLDDGAGVPGVIVTATVSSSLTAKVTTDTEGRFSLTLHEDSHQLSIEHDRLRAETLSVSRENPRADIAVKPECSIQLSVTSRAGISVVRLSGTDFLGREVSREFLDWPVLPGRRVQEQKLLGLLPGEYSIVGTGVFESVACSVVLQRNGDNLTRRVTATESSYSNRQLTIGGLVFLDGVLATNEQLEVKATYRAHSRETSMTLRTSKAGEYEAVIPVDDAVERLTEPRLPIVEFSVRDGASIRRAVTTEELLGTVSWDLRFESGPVLQIVGPGSEPVLARGISMSGRLRALPLRSDGRVGFTPDQDGTYELRIPVWEFIESKLGFQKRRVSGALTVVEETPQEVQLELKPGILSVVVSGARSPYSQCFCRVWIEGRPGAWTWLEGATPVHAATLASLPDNGELEFLAVGASHTFDGWEKAYKLVELSPRRGKSTIELQPEVGEYRSVRFEKEGRALAAEELVLAVGREAIGIRVWNQKRRTFGDRKYDFSIGRALGSVEDGSWYVRTGPWPKDTWFVTRDGAISAEEVIRALEASSKAVVEISSSVVCGQRNGFNGGVKLVLQDGRVLISEDIHGWYCFPVSESELPARIELSDSAEIPVPALGRYDL